MRKHASIITAAVILISIISIIITNKYNSKLFVKEVSASINSNWFYNWDGEQQQQINTLPINLSNKAKRGENLYLITYLPKFRTNDTTLLFRTSFQKIKVFIEDEPIYEYGYSSRQALGKTIGSGYHFVRLPDNFENKKLTVILNSQTSANGIVNEVNIGSYSAHLIYIIQNNFLTFFIPSFLFIISLIMFFVFIPIALFKKIKPDVIYLAIFILFISLWFVSENRVFQTLLSNQVQNYIFAFLMFYSFMIPLFVFIVKFYKPVNKNEMLTVLHIHAIFFFVACFLQFGGIAEMYELIQAYWCLIIADVIIFARAAIKMYSYANLETKVFWFGMSFPSVLGIVNMITMKLRIFEDVILFEIGMLMFAITTIVSVIIIILNYNYDKASSDTLYKLAYKDILTGLKNRTAYEEHCQLLLTNGANIDGFAVVVADLNNLKKLNDDIGHYAGDIGIKEVADCLSEAFAELAEIYRYGGDEFILICKNINSDIIANAVELFNDLIKQTNEANPLVKISVAIGVAEFNAVIDGNINDLIKRADKEMYKVKQIMKTGVYSEDLNSENINFFES